MRNHYATYALFAVALSWITACTTTVVVKDVSELEQQDPPIVQPSCQISGQARVCGPVSQEDHHSSGQISGIPFRVLTPYTVTVFARKSKVDDKVDDEYEYEQVFQTSTSLPNPNKLYSINYVSQFFANSTFELTMREDNTVSALNTTGESTLPQAIKDIGKQSTDIAAAIASYENQRKAALKESMDAEATLLKAKAGLIDVQEAPATNRAARIEAALKALNEAQAAERVLDNLPATATSQQRGDAEGALRLARLRANQAHLRAGLSEPYPGVFP